MSKKQKKMLVRILIAFALMVILSLLPVEGVVRFTLFMVPYLVVGYDILKKAVKGIYNRQVFDENFLMAVATVGAIALGEYTEGVAVMLFYQIGELFQSYAVGKSRRNISELMDIRPDYANLYSESDTTVVDPDEVEIGSIILVKPGEKVPIDGVIVEGETTLNTSALTGESVPRTVRVGDEIISGCINMSGVILVKTTKEFGESTVSKILELVENASSKKSKTENFITRFSRYYTPAVCIGAVLLAIVPVVVNLIMGNPANASKWIYRALTFLVISCPCALVISIPLSFFAGIGGASKQGILVKGSNYLEALAGTEIVVFDKTGTLTKGVFDVKDICSQDISREELLDIVAHAEIFSTHPIAQSLQRAYDRELSEDRVKNAKVISGHGIEASVDGKNVLAGNAKLMDSYGIAYTKCNDVGTIVYVAIEKRYAGYITISDEIKENAAKAIKLLKKISNSRTIMLTGDGEKVAKAVANSLEIDEVHAGLLPEDKVILVEKNLEKKASKRGKLIFVGDGINDAPVLSRADIGVAMGALGSDAAIEAADVVLMDDDPLKLSEAIRISKRCMRIVYQNIFFALGIKVLCLGLGAVGIANMWLAIFADVGVMVLAVLNSIRVLCTKQVLCTRKD